LLGSAPDAAAYRRLAVLARPEHPGEHRERAATEAVVGKLGIELVLNARTARSLGLAIPKAVLLRADRVIE
jgi:hypothetical protein